MGRKLRQKTKRQIPGGIHFLKGPADLVSLMSPEALALDGRGGKIDRPATRFAARSPWKQQLEAERLRALDRPHAYRQPAGDVVESTRSQTRQARFGPRP